jgi:hypothetical protein
MGELVIEQMKFAIAKLKHERFGQSSERSALRQGAGGRGA